MALYPQVNFTEGGLNDRTHTNLVRSEGMSPAEKWILDPDLPGLFEYRFGGFGYVVIPKGKIVAVSAPKYDWETEKVVNCLTIATGSNTPIGVAPYNFYEKKRDRMGDNQLSIINREYIEVPFLTAGSDADAMKWGCAVAANSTALSAGDFVKPDALGRFVKWEINTPVTEVAGVSNGGDQIYLTYPIKPGTNPTVITTATGEAVSTTISIQSYAAGMIKSTENLTADMSFVYTSAASDSIDQMVGQILAVETDLPPLGWLAYFLNMDTQVNDLTNGIRSASYPPAIAGGYPGTADFAALVKQAFGPGAANAPGIKHLTDGYFRAKVNHSNAAIHNVADVAHEVASAGCSINGSSVLTVPQDAGYVGGMITIPFINPLAGDEAVVVKFDAATVAAGSKYHIDYLTNQISLYVDSADNGKTVNIACVTIENQVPGIPTEWDYKGSVGAVRILLCK